MKPAVLPNASETAKSKLAELELEFRTPAMPEDLGMPEDVATTPMAPTLPELSLPGQAGAEVEIPAASLPDIFDIA